jgi:hypothetical protein
MPSREPKSYGMASAILQCKIRKPGRSVIFATDRLTFLVMPWQSRLIKPVDPSFPAFFQISEEYAANHERRLDSDSDCFRCS